MNALTLTNDVSNVPAIVTPQGKTNAARKLAVVSQASLGALLVLSAEKGKVGNAARARTATIYGITEIIRAAASANYLPLAETLAGLTGESVGIRNRAQYEAIEGRFEDALAQLDATNKGYTISKKDGTSKPNAKRTALTKCIQLIGAVHAKVDEIHAKRAEEKARELQFAAKDAAAALTVIE